jgi:hypothetical protein
LITTTTACALADPRVCRRADAPTVTEATLRR